MSQIRAGAHAVWRYLIVLFVLVVIVQFFLAGVGVFNPNESSEPYDPHSAVGFLGARIGSFVLMVLALIAWRDRVTIGGSVAPLRSYQFNPTRTGGVQFLGRAIPSCQRTAHPRPFRLAHGRAWGWARARSPRRFRTWLRPATADDGARSRRGRRRRGEALRAGRRAPGRAERRRAPRSGRHRPCRPAASSTGF